MRRERERDRPLAILSQRAGGGRGRSLPSRPGAAAAAAPPRRQQQQLRGRLRCPPGARPHTDPRPGQLRPRHRRRLRPRRAEPRRRGALFTASLARHLLPAAWGRLRSCETGRGSGVLTGGPGRRRRRRAPASAWVRSTPVAPPFLPPELNLCCPCPGAGLPDGHGPPIPVRGRPVMLPKVETEALGLARSHGEQGQMPENMQGKEALRGAPAPAATPPPGSPCGLQLSTPSRPLGYGAARGRQAPTPGTGIKVYGS